MNELQLNAQALTSAQAARIHPAITTADDHTSFIIKAPPVQAALQFGTAAGKYGTLRFDENGCFQFEGDASASAQVLFDHLKKLTGR